MNTEFKKRLTFGLFALILVTALAGGLMFAPVLTKSAQAAQANPSQNQQPSVALQAGSDVLAAYEQATTNLYKQAISSVVRIDVTVQMTANGMYGYGQMPFELPPNHPSLPGQPGGGYSSHGQGSGFVWDTAGHIVTNFHVVKDASNIDVTFADGTTVPAKLIGSDPDADVAVLKVDLPASQLQPLPTGNSDTLQVGQLTFAIGTPFGQDFSMTSGIVSAINRTIQSGNTQFSIPEVIQTDASINPGNSGGPLFNRQGEVIGINTMILSRSGSNAGVGFAVPINIAKRVVPELIKNGQYNYAWLGISGATLTDDMAKLMKLPASTQGAIVMKLAQDGPAANAGLQGSTSVGQINGMDVPYGGDVIIAIDNHPITSMDDLITYLIEKTRPGDKVTLDIIRDGQQQTIKVTLGTRPTM